MTLDELAAICGEPIEHVSAWASLGLFETERNGHYGPTPWNGFA